MRKINFLFVAVILTAFGFYACNSGPGGYKKTDSGLMYKFHKHDEKGVLPMEGDMLTADIVYKTEKDSVLFDSRSNGNPFRIPLMKSEYKGDIYEGFSMMAAGDSATFVVLADSFFLRTARAPEVPKFIKPGSKLYFSVKLNKIQKKAEYEKEQKAAMEAQMKQMEERKAKEESELTKYLSDNKIKTKATESGLIFIDIKKGKGAKPEKGKKVKLEYKGSLTDGTEFDSSAKHGKPFEFTIGENQVIPGMEEGVTMMKAGGKAKLIIPSKIGYGSRMTGSIPPFSTLIFEVELVEVN